jgi:hypothetical protein
MVLLCRCNAENRRVATDTQGQRQHRQGGERGAPPERPHGIAEVVPKIGGDTLPGGHSGDCGLRRDGLFGAAELAHEAVDPRERGAQSFRFGGALRHQQLVLLLQMAGQLLGDFRLARRRQPQLRQALPDFLPPAASLQPNMFHSNILP